MTTPQERTELQRLAEQATPGPWIVGYEDGSGNGERGIDIVAPEVESLAQCVVGGGGEYDREYGPRRDEDAAYIAAANPAAILDLLSLAAESEELRADLKEAKRRLAQLSDELAWNSGPTPWELGRAKSLESRYAALEKAAQRIGIEIKRQENDGTAEPGDDEVILDRRLLKALAAALPPEEGEQDRTDT